MGRPRTKGMTELAERLRGLWSRPATGAVTPDVEARVAALEARLEHLERAHEGLQDAFYRQSVLEHENISELRRKTEPSRVARDLDEDARRRGL
jgi:hypothetical protein